MRNALAALAAVLLLASGAQAQTLYPRTIGSGESAEIDYGPGPRGNIVGGGPFRVIAPGDGTNSPVIEYLDPTFAQPGRVGVVPRTAGSGESTTVEWVPVR